MTRALRYRDSDIRLDFLTAGSLEGHFLTARSSSPQRARGAAHAFDGQEFVRTDSAAAGLGWSPGTGPPPRRRATAARASHREMTSRWPRKAEPCPPGSCTEWVASNTTGRPGGAGSDRERMSGYQVV